LVIAMAMSEAYKQESLRKTREMLERLKKFPQQPREDVPTGHVDAMAQWREQAAEADRARREAVRNRKRAEAEMIIYKQHEQRQPQQSAASNVASMDDLVDTVRATNKLAEACNAQFDDLASEILSLREKLVAAETRSSQLEASLRDQRAELTRSVTATAVLRSELSDLKVELRQFVYDHRIAGVSAATSAKEIN
jgi:chromosome segregation ATPase